MKSLRDGFLIFVLPIPLGILTWIAIASIGGGLAVLGGLFVGFVVTCLAFFGGIYAAMHFGEQDEQKVRGLETVEEMNRLVVSSSNALGSLPAVLGEAERALDAADDEFQEGAFGPFWDEVERAATRLATFHNTIAQIVENAAQHRQACVTLPGRIRPFELRRESLPDARRTAARMREIVRMAQKNFQFATIYEQRKTNQLLVAGFSSLGQAIGEMSTRLDTALERLDNVQRRRSPSDTDWRGA